MQEITQIRPTFAEINLDNLAFNFHSVKNFVQQDVKIMAVVKADAYGHGSVECAKRLETEGVDWFGVALPSEAVTLRENGIQKPILCLGSFWEGQEDILLHHNLTPVIYNLDLAKSLNKLAKERGIKAPVHIKIDTGMGRVGVRFDEIEEFVKRLVEFENLDIEGLMTHFASADDLNENEFTNLQIQRFNDSLQTFNKIGFNPQYTDLANSPASLAHPNSFGNMIRLGGVLYGIGKDILPNEIELPELKAVMSIKSKIAQIKKVPKGETLGYSRTHRTERDSLIATIPIGYHDGYTRAFSNKSKVIIKGAFAKCLGRVSMDWTILDVTDIENVNIGDSVTVIGESENLKVTAEELAKLAKSISYEITCGINRRVPRIYL